MTALDLPEHWDPPEFIRAVEVYRGRPIIRLPLPPAVPVGLCGLWLARENDDVVFHRVTNDPLQERHIVLHEAGHMLLGHGPESVGGTSALATALTGVSLEGLDLSKVIAAKGGPNNYQKTDEHDAEMFATLVMTAARQDGERRRPRILRSF